MRQIIIIIACISLSTVLGTIHAFSVFIPEWERLPDASRANVSFVYSLALLSLTVAVLLGYKIYERLAPALVFLIVGLLSWAGLLLSANSASLVSLYINYGVLFGCANGIGYGYTLQLAGQVASGKRGLAMVMVTAFYAVGATTAPLLFVFLIERGGNALALNFVSWAVLVTAIFAATAVYWSQASYLSEQNESKRVLSSVLLRARIMFWIGYGCAVCAGLIVIGHAYSIATWLTFDSETAAWAATIVAFGNMTGGYSAGYCLGRLSDLVLLRYLPLITFAGLFILVMPIESLWGIAFLGLGLTGFSYGAIIALYPVAVANVFGSNSSARIYGQVFTAWGLAGLSGPWISGWLYDQTASYTTPLILAMILSIGSSVAVRYSLPKGDISADESGGSA